MFTFPILCRVYIGDDAQRQRRTFRIHLAIGTQPLKQGDFENVKESAGVLACKTFLDQEVVYSRPPNGFAVRTVPAHAAIDIKAPDGTVDFQVVQLCGKGQLRNLHRQTMQIQAIAFSP